MQLHIMYYMVTRLRSCSILCTESMPYDPVHNCHHIKSCDPSVKQYIMTHHNTEFIMYTCSLFFIYNTKVSRPRAALWNGFNFVNILYTGLCPLRDTSFEVFSPPLLPFLPCSLPSLLNPSSARIHWTVSSSGYLPWSFLPSIAASPLAPSLPRSIHPPLATSLPSFPRVVHASFRPFINQPSLNPPFLHWCSLPA